MFSLYTKSCCTVFRRRLRRVPFRGYPFFSRLCVRLLPKEVRESSSVASDTPINGRISRLLDTVFPGVFWRDSLSCSLRLVLVACLLSALFSTTQETSFHFSTRHMSSGIALHPFLSRLSLVLLFLLVRPKSPPRSLVSRDPTPSISPGLEEVFRIPRHQPRSTPSKKGYSFMLSYFSSSFFLPARRDKLRPVVLPSIHIQAG